MKFKAKYNRLFPAFKIEYRESYYKEIASISIFFFRFGFGVLFKKKVSKNSRHAIDTMD